MRYVIWRDAEVAELADAHGSGPCDSNIMRVQVPSSARRLKSKDLSLFSFIPTISRYRGAQRVPRIIRLSPTLLSLHTLPFPSLIPPIHSADGPPGTDAPGWRELASSWLAGKCIGGPRTLVWATKVASCVPGPPPLAFFWELRGTLLESREASAPGGPSARNSHHYEPLPKKRKKPPRQITPPERFFLFSPTN